MKTTGCPWYLSARTAHTSCRRSVLTTSMTRCRSPGTRQGEGLRAAGRLAVVALLGRIWAGRSAQWAVVDGQDPSSRPLSAPVLLLVAKGGRPNGRRWRHPRPPAARSSVFSRASRQAFIPRPLPPRRGHAIALAGPSSQSGVWRADHSAPLRPRSIASRRPPRGRVGRALGGGGQIHDGLGQGQAALGQAPEVHACWRPATTRPAIGQAPSRRRTGRDCAHLERICLPPASAASLQPASGRSCERLVQRADDFECSSPPVVKERLAREGLPLAFMSTCAAAWGSASSPP